VGIEVDAVRPGAAEVALAMGLLVELGEMTCAEVAADLGIRPSMAVAVLRPQAGNYVGRSLDKAVRHGQAERHHPVSLAGNIG
jgi:hypothetical protein